MSLSISERVRLANLDQNPNVIAKLPSGWLIAADYQPVAGYCILLADPVVKDLNSLSDDARIAYSLDCIRVGDALLKVTGAYRINYETWGNLDPALHTHIVPRYRSEPEEKRIMPICKAYDFDSAPRFDPYEAQDFLAKMRAEF